VRGNEGPLEPDNPIDRRLHDRYQRARLTA